MPFTAPLKYDVFCLKIIKKFGKVWQQSLAKNKIKFCFKNIDVNISLIYTYIFVLIYTIV